MMPWRIGALQDTAVHTNNRQHGNSRPVPGDRADAAEEVRQEGRVRP